MATVRYTADGGHYRVGGYGFDPGDVKDVDDDLADYLAEHDDFDVVDEDDEVEGSAETDLAPAPDLDGEAETLPFNPADHTNDEVAEKVATIDDKATLVALRRLEEEQQDRTGATDAITNRLDELEG
jgi:hypothetical protein